MIQKDIQKVEFDWLVEFLCLAYRLKYLKYEEPNLTW